MELVSIFLFDLISNYYFASFHSQKALQTPTSKLTSSLTTSKHQQHQQHQPITQPQQQQQQLKANDSQRQSVNHYSSTNTTVARTNNYNNSSNSTTAKNFNYICEFTQPISMISFKERVRINKVHLETCQVNSAAGHVSVSCTIRVLNQSYEKSVIVRYTTDEWHTCTDSLASYKPGSCDGWSDKFTSTFSVTNQVKSFQSGQRIIFAVRYMCGGDNVYWDNNGGLNYSIKKVQ